MRHQIGQKLKVKLFANRSLGSLVTKENLKIQHFWGNSVKNTIVRNGRFLDTKTSLVFY